LYHGHLNSYDEDKTRALRANSAAILSCFLLDVLLTDDLLSATRYLSLRGYG
jgi:hypothetical protein